MKERDTHTDTQTLTCPAGTTPDESTVPFRTRHNSSTLIVISCSFTSVSTGGRPRPRVCVKQDTHDLQQVTLAQVCSKYLQVLTTCQHTTYHDGLSSSVQSSLCRTFNPISFTHPGTMHTDAFASCVPVPHYPE